MTNIAEELEKLARLHESGELTDAEFAKAKAAALNRKSSDAPSALDDPDSLLGTAANRYVNFQIVMTVVGLVIFLIIFVTVFLPRMNSFPRP